MGHLSLLQEIFPTQGSNTGLLHYRRILYQLSHKGSPRILGWVAYPFSSRSSQTRNRTRVSCLAGDLLLLLRCFSRVRLCATPETAAHQAPPSLGFSRREHWSGLPFPSPCMKVKSESEVTQSCPTPSDPMDCSLPGSSVHGIFQARVLECHCLLWHCRWILTNLAMREALYNNMHDF